MPKLTIGLIREGKVQQDNRVALTPSQCKTLQDTYTDLKIIVEPSPIRCFTDEAYQEAGIEVIRNMEACDLLIGIKEVPEDQLIPGKTYMFFSHTIKQQAYNRDMLRAILENNIRLIDHELIADNEGKRLIGFGHYAGVVGAHYGLMMYGKKTGAYQLIPAHEAENYATLAAYLQATDFPPMKALIAGTGNVADGAQELLAYAGFQEVSPEDFKTIVPTKPCYTKLGLNELYKRKDGKPFDREAFKANPEDHYSDFLSYAEETDILVNAVYWEPGIPRHFNVQDTKNPVFKVKVIADVSCDIEGSVPITKQHTLPEDPVYGIDPQQQSITAPYQPSTIDIMAISNLPNQLPKDASHDFGEVMKQTILPAYLEDPEQHMFKDATITRNGDLTEPYQYLTSFLSQSTQKNEA